MREATTKPSNGFRWGNRLLAQLPSDDLLNLRPHLERVPLVRGRLLCDADEPITRVYFIEAGVVSLAATFQNGGTSEMATAGREGLVGVSSLLDGDAALGRCLVQASGSALAIEVSQFRGVLQSMPALRTVCDAYVRAFLGQALQTAACNSVHTVAQRCARSLLLSHDRSDGDTLPLTQEFLAKMLGVCRSTVTVAAGALQEAGLICYSRGALTVLDRTGLEGASCECYRAIREQFDRLLPRTCERSLQRAYERPRERPLTQAFA